MIDTNEIQKIISDYFENLHSSKLENLKLGTFQDICDIPK
jgi:hypothetical protein